MKIHEYNEMMAYLTRPAVNRVGFKKAGLVTTPIQRDRLRKKFPDIDFNFREYPYVGVKSTEDDYYRAKRYFSSSEFKTGQKADFSKIQMKLAGTEKALTKEMKDYLKQRYPENKNIEKLWMEATPIRRGGWKKNLKTWLDIKDIPGIEKLKGKPGEGAFNAQLELLKEFNKIKPTYKTSSNPKGTRMTIEEWLKASPRVRQTGRMTEDEFLKFREKTAKHVRGFMKSQKEKLSPEDYEKRYGIPKKEAALEKAQKLYPQRYQPGRAVLQIEDNVLLNYMTRAAKQQSKNLNKNLAEYIDIEKDGKFLGVRDVKTGTNYYHAQYPKSNLKPGDKLITSHPEYEKVKELKKAASKFKYELPNKTIASYFSDYKRVPNLGELANFLTRAGIKQGDSKELVNQKINLIAKYSDQSMKANPLHLHHMLSAEIQPTKKIQLRLQDQNDMAGKIVEQVKRGNISKADASKQLKKINVSAKIGDTVVGAREDVPVGQQVSVAKRRTTKMFFEALKQRPDLVKLIAKRFGIPGKVTAASVAAFMTVNAISPQEALAGTGAEEAGSILPEAAAGAGAAGAYAARKPIWKGIKAAGRVAGKTLAPLAVPLEAGFVLSDLKSGASTPEALANIVLAGGLVTAKEKRDYIIDKYGKDVYSQLQAYKTGEDYMDMPQELPDDFKAIQAEADQYVLDLRQQRAAEFERKSNLPKPEISPWQAAEGGRVGFKDGSPKSPGRRAFIKGITALAALPLVGKYFKLGKVLQSAKPYLGPTVEKIKGMPEWFPSLVKKLWNEGEDVTKTVAYKERQVVKRGTLEGGDDVDMIYDMDTGDVSINVTPKKGKYETSSGAYNKEYSLDYKKGEVIEEGKYAGKTAPDEFGVTELEGRMTPDAADIDWDANYTTVDDAMSDLTELEGFAKSKSTKQIHKKKGTKPKDVFPDYDPGDYDID